MGARLKRLRKELGYLGRLLATNSFASVARIFLANRLGRRRVVAVDVLGRRLHIRTASADLRVALATLGGEFDGLRLAYPRSRRGLILDAGGYIGTAAIALAEMYPEATIVTIEPSRENFPLLRRNTAGFPNILAVNAALVAEGVGEEVALMSRGTGEWGFTLVDRPHDRPARFSEKVPSITIGRILAEHGCDRIMICKMDIEGAEMPLLRRPGWLDQVDILMIELHERIVPGCEAAFWEASRGRFVSPAGGEKLISVGPGCFTGTAIHATGCPAAAPPPGDRSPDAGGAA